jgi:broad specificity phosphatase PhoE
VSTTFLLVRHAAHEAIGTVLSGRTLDAPLGARGRAQAAVLGRRLQRERLAAIRSSPRRRTIETAEIIAEATGVGPVEIAAELDEVDFGTWSGQSFAALDADPLWRRWNSRRSEVRPPGGETMQQVEQRILGTMAELARVYAGATLVLVSHAEIIRAAVLHVLGMPADNWSRIAIDPAALTTIGTGAGGARLLTLNERPEP